MVSEEGLCRILDDSRSKCPKQAKLWLYASRVRCIFRLLTRHIRSSATGRANKNRKFCVGGRLTTQKILLFAL